jgi:hypothetical protein
MSSQFSLINKLSAANKKLHIYAVYVMSMLKQDGMLPEDYDEWDLETSWAENYNAEEWTGKFKSLKNNKNAVKVVNVATPNVVADIANQHYSETPSEVKETKPKKPRAPKKPKTVEPVAVAATEPVTEPVANVTENVQETKPKKPRAPKKPKTVDPVAVAATEPVIEPAANVTEDVQETKPKKPRAPKKPKAVEPQTPSVEPSPAIITPEPAAPKVKKPRAKKSAGSSEESGSDEEKKAAKPRKPRAKKDTTSDTPDIVQQIVAAATNTPIIVDEPVHITNELVTETYESAEEVPADSDEIEVKVLLIDGVEYLIDDKTNDVYNTDFDLIGSYNNGKLVLN